MGFMDNLTHYPSLGGSCNPAGSAPFLGSNIGETVVLSPSAKSSAAPGPS